MDSQVQNPCQFSIYARFPQRNRKQAEWIHLSLQRRRDQSFLDNFFNSHNALPREFPQNASLQIPSGIDKEEKYDKSAVESLKQTNTRSAKAWDDVRVCFQFLCPDVSKQTNQLLLTVFGLIRHHVRYYSQQQKIRCKRNNTPEQCISRISSEPVILQNILLDDSIELGADERQIALNAVKRTAVQTIDQATTKQAIHLKDLLINLRKLRQRRSRSLSDKHSSIMNNKDVSQPNILFERLELIVDKHIPSDLA